MTRRATVKIIGNLGRSPVHLEKKLRTIDEVQIETPQKLASAIKEIEDEYHLSLPRESILILVNGIEANALDDLETVIGEGDQVVLIPMFHGGGL